MASADAIVGGEVRIAGARFQVVGVLASKGQGAGFGNPDDQVLVPIETARYRLIGADRLRTINLLSPSENDIAATMAEAQKILRRTHKLRTGQADDFTIRSQADFLQTLGETTQVFTLLLAGIAAVSLLVGGIGIMNIMLVSVTERTREIGVRKALGATTDDILLQFLIEALVLCLLGGLIGIALGAGASTIAACGVPMEHVGRAFRRSCSLSCSRRSSEWSSACGQPGARPRSIRSKRCDTSSGIGRISKEAMTAGLMAPPLPESLIRRTFLSLRFTNPRCSTEGEPRCRLAILR